MSDYNFLITGITGFFGRNFVDKVITKYPSSKIVGTAHSESKLAFFKKIFPDVKIYLIELSNPDIEITFDKIVKTHKINYIIHSAAMKHVDICQENPTMANLVNVVASNKLIQIAKNNKINNMIALGTDKSNDPCNIYGHTKKIMQDNVIKNNYSIYQSANFFWSDGSILDIWFNQYIRNKPITIRNPGHVRFFNTIDYVSSRILDNINCEGGTIMSPKYVYIVKIGDLLEAFRTYFNYHKVEFIPTYEYEKLIEKLSDDEIKKIETNVDDLIKLIDVYYKNMI